MISLNCPDYSPTRQNYVHMIVSFACKQLEAAQTIKWKLHFRFGILKQIGLVRIMKVLKNDPHCTNSEQ